MCKAIVTVVLLLMFAGTVSADVTGPRVYFSDAAMTAQTGAERVFCGGTTGLMYGSTSTYRRVEGFECETGYLVVVCEEWNGTSWVPTTCPY